MIRPQRCRKMRRNSVMEMRRAASTNGPPFDGDFYYSRSDTARSPRHLVFQPVENFYNSANERAGEILIHSRRREFQRRLQHDVSLLDAGDSLKRLIRKTGWLPRFMQIHTGINKTLEKSWRFFLCFSSQRLKRSSLNFAKLRGHRGIVKLALKLLNKV